MPLPETSSFGINTKHDNTDIMHFEDCSGILNTKLPSERTNLRTITVVKSRSRKDIKSFVDTQIVKKPVSLKENISIVGI